MSDHEVLAVEAQERSDVGESFGDTCLQGGVIECECDGGGRGWLSVSVVGEGGGE